MHEDMEPGPLLLDHTSQMVDDNDLRYVEWARRFSLTHERLHGKKEREWKTSGHSRHVTERIHDEVPDMPAIDKELLYHFEHLMVRSGVCFEVIELLPLA